jgi:hypothetical protein
MNKNLFELYPYLDAELKNCCAELICNLQIKFYNYRYIETLEDIFDTCDVYHNKVNFKRLNDLISEIQAKNIQIYPIPIKEFNSFSLLGAQVPKTYDLKPPLDLIVNKFAEKMKQNYLNHLEGIFPQE